MSRFDVLVAPIDRYSEDTGKPELLLFAKELVRTLKHEITAMQRERNYQVRSPQEDIDEAFLRLQEDKQ